MKRIKSADLAVLRGIGPEWRHAKDSRESQILIRLADKNLVERSGGRRDRNPMFRRTTAGAELADHQAIN